MRVFKQLGFIMIFSFAGLFWNCDSVKFNGTSFKKSKTKETTENTLAAGNTETSASENQDETNTDSNAPVLSNDLLSILEPTIALAQTTEQGKLECAAGKYMAGIKGDGTLICKDLPVPTTQNSEYILVVDQKTSGTNGGGGSAGSFFTRDLNTIKKNTSSNSVTLAANQLKFAAGTYRCQIHAPVVSVQFAKARLRNVTKGTTILVGTSIFAHGSYPVTAISEILGVFTVAAGQDIEPTDELEVQQYLNSVYGHGFELGMADSTEEPEIYTTVECFKET